MTGSGLRGGIDALVTAVKEMGRIVDIETPVLDIVLGLVRQLGRTQSLYPTGPEPQVQEHQLARAS